MKPISRARRLLSEILYGMAMCDPYCYGHLVCGALVGTVWGVFHGDAALGLDGAVLGCLCLACCGAVFGLVLYLTGEPAPPSDGLSPPSNPP